MQYRTKTLILLTPVFLFGCSSIQYSQISLDSTENKEIISSNNLEISQKKNIVAVRVPRIIKGNKQLAFNIFVSNTSNKEFLFSPRYVRVRFVAGNNSILQKPLAHEEIEARLINSNAWKIAGMAYVTAYNNAGAGHTVDSGTYQSNSSGMLYANNGKLYDYTLHTRGAYTFHSYDSMVAHYEITQNNANLQNFINSELDRIENNSENPGESYLQTTGVIPGRTTGGSLVCDIPLRNENYLFEILVDAGGELHQFKYIVKPAELR